MVILLILDFVCVIIFVILYLIMYLLRGYFLYTFERIWINDKCFCSFSFLKIFIELF